MRDRRRLVWAALGALAACFAYEKRRALLQVLTVLLFAGAFTLMLLPLEKRLERRGLGAPRAALLSVLALLLAVFTLVSAFIPYLVAKTLDLVRRVTPAAGALLERGVSLLERAGVSGAGGLPELVTGAASALTSTLARGSVAFAAQAGQFAFALVISYYLLSERQAISNHLLLLLPLRRRTAFLSAARGCANAVLGYLSGLLKTSLFVGGATLAGLLLLGVRDAPLLALFMAVLEVLPYLGPVLAAVPIALSALLQGPGKAALALLLVLLVQQIEGNFVSPHFTAASTSLSPLAALLSVFALGSLFGVWGILLAVPLVVAARSALWSARQAEAFSGVLQER